jgi:hypothetical protein
LLLHLRAAALVFCAALLSKTAKKLKAWVGDAQSKAEAAARASRRGARADRDGADAAGPQGGGQNGGASGGKPPVLVVPEGRHTHLAAALRNAGACTPRAPPSAGSTAAGRG